MRPAYDVRPANSYPADVKREIHLVRLIKDKGRIEAVGSYAYRIQKYPSDIDLMESWVDYNGEVDLVSKFIAGIQSVTRDILRDSPNTFFLEFKAGIDRRFELPQSVGTLVNGRFVRSPLLIPFAKDLLDRSLISPEEFNQLKVGTNRDSLAEILRQKKTIRWTAAEVLSGSKILAGGLRITLKEAIETKSIAKLDVIGWVGDRYKEVTNFLSLGYSTQDGNVVPLNVDYDFTSKPAFIEKISREIPEETEQLLFSADDYSPFKAIKRMFSLARQINDYKMLATISPAIKSNLSSLYQIKGDLETLQKIPEYTAKVPAVSIRISQELDQFKEQLSGIVELSTSTITKLGMRLDNGDWSEATEYLTSIIKIWAQTFLDENGLSVPKYPYLPKVITYIRKSMDT